TRVGTVWNGFRSSRSSGRLPPCTSMVSTWMLFSASTILVRWLQGSSAREKSVITVVRSRQCRTDGRWRASRWPRGALLHVLPELLLQEIGEQEEDYQECQHAHAQIAAFELHRLGDVVEEIDRVANE